MLEPVQWEGQMFPPGQMEQEPGDSWTRVWHDLPLISAEASPPPPVGRAVERRSRHLGLIRCQRQQLGRAQGEQAGCPALRSARQEAAGMF